MKKFLCYDTNDAASGKINVSANGILKPNSTLPSTNGASYQQLVTDDSGKVKWEDRLAYESDPVTTEIFKESIFSFESPVDEGGSYSSEKAWPEEVIPFNVYSVTKIVIVWDSVEYQYNVDSNSIDSEGSIVVGNRALDRTGLEDTGEPFMADLMDVGVAFITKSTEESHIISISIVYRALHKIDKKFIPGNRICIGHDELDENGGVLFVESDNPSGIVKVLDSNDEWDKSIIRLDENNYLSLQSDVFIIRKVALAGWITLSDIPTSVGEKFEAVEKRETIIKALSSRHEYLIKYDFSFNNGIVVYSYLSKLGESDGFASAVVSAENGMVYSITLKLNSDNKTAKVVLKCIA